MNALVQRGEMLLGEEGFRPRPYQDHLGNWTFGHGLTWISESESMAIVMRRIPMMLRELTGTYPWLDGDMPIEVAMVMLHMSYQLGLAGLGRFTKTLDHLENKRFLMASHEMLDSKWARQTPERAKRLSDRIAAIARDYEDTDDQDDGGPIIELH